MASVAKRPWTYKGETKTKWIVRYFEGGKHRQKTFEKKKDADAFKQKVEREISDGVHIAPENVRTVAQVAELFLRYQEARWRDGRIGQARYINLKVSVDASIIPLLGHRTISEITAADIEEFYAAMCRQGIKRRKPVAPQTALTRVTMFNLMCSFAVRRGYLTKNVVPDATKQLAGIRRTVIQTFSSDEVKLLLTVADSRGHGCKHRPYLQTKCFVHLAAFCGLRLGEIFGLTIENIDMANRVIKVRHSMTVYGELKGPKSSAGLRDVPLPAHIHGHISEWIRLYYVENDAGLIFTPANGGTRRHTVFNLHNWMGLLKRAGLWREGGDNYHFHALRHFAASWMIENGLPITDVASLLGHQKFDMTLQVYAHPVVRGHRRHEVLDQMVSAMDAVPALPTPSRSLPKPGIAQELRIDA